MNQLAEQISNLISDEIKASRFIHDFVFFQSFVGASRKRVQKLVTKKKMSKNTIVETEFGKVRGVAKVSEYGADYVAFLGIRYARPPIGDLRFKVSDDGTLSLFELQAQIR